MSLAHLNIHHFRNIHHAELTLHPRFNFFSGANGSGKTTILEAIYLLSRGHSFRTREAAPLISYEQPCLTVFARTHHEETVSIQKQRTGPTLVKLNYQTCGRSSELAHFLPCQIFYQDIFQIMDAGPATRRNVLDWGLFHVKQSYHAIWKDYARVLKQRNALLRRKAKPNEFIPWDKLLVELAYALDEFRREYVADWSDVFAQVLHQLTPISCHLAYFKGWDRKQIGTSFATLLTEQFSRDMQQQYTHLGAHQADLILNSVDSKAKQVLSRGQQKIILIALKLAQAQLLQQPCIYLFDDLTAELDRAHLMRLLQFLQQITGQFFITSIEAELLLPGLHEPFFHYQLEKGISFALKN